MKHRYKLVILICTLPDRSEPFMGKLALELERQIQELDAWERVTYFYLGSPEYRGGNTGLKVGMKRNILVSMALDLGEYLCFLDDDDWISKDYIKELLQGTETGADVVSFKAWYSHDGKDKRPVYYSIRYPKNESQPDKYLRLPNHLCAMKANKWRKVPFPNLAFSEDNSFAERVKPLLNTEHLIDKFLYEYKHLSSVSKTKTTWQIEKGIKPKKL